MTSKTKHSCQ